MTYAYTCENGHDFDVIKSYRDMDVNEFCPKCEAPAIRQFVPSKLYISGAKVTHAEYNPGLGCVVKSKAHKQEILRQRGLVEVGNDFGSGEKMNKHFDSIREEKLKKRWEEV